MTTRRLSLRQALACEQGHHARCRCRCRGQHHGAKRFGDDPIAGHFMRLPENDPHRIRRSRAGWKQYTLDDIPRPQPARASLPAHPERSTP